MTAALTVLEPRAQHFRRLKIGGGRTAGYRMGEQQDLIGLESSGGVLYSNRRYGATYVVDRPEIERMRAAGLIPVVHLGQPEGVVALLDAEPSASWLVVELWCPRETAAERIAARDTGDTEARLIAWDETPRLTAPDLRIDTNNTAAEDAAQQIMKAVE
ncbi:kinase [Nocardia higoensis]|uniref:kinase n=1 Tax=Nocardia higoensis TaxID=228599 RepID=UPI002B4AB828|nr:kinase [Nocardia higoensis]